MIGPFYYASAGTTREYGGSGLGVAIYKKLVELIPTEKITDRYST
jgi:signal transduction histidine kinase